MVYIYLEALTELESLAKNKVILQGLIFIPELHIMHNLSRFTWIHTK